MGEDQKLVWPKLARRVDKLARSTNPIFDGSLGRVFGRQVHFNKALKRSFKGASVADFAYLGSARVVRATADPEWRALFRTHVLACVAELTEALEWTPWKPWRSRHKRKQMTAAEVRECKLEVVDALCFLLNLWALLGGNGLDLALYHAAKTQENHRRQRAKY